MQKLWLKWPLRSGRLLMCYAEAVDYVSSRGWMVDTSETTFDPNRAMTGDEVAQMLMNMVLSK